MSIDSFLSSLSSFGAWTSIAAALAGFLASIVASWMSFRAKTPELPDTNARLEDQTRIDEVRDYLARNESVARWSGRSSGLLIFTQVVIGGVLATSFVQSQLDPSQIGFLGVLVLVSSLVQQQFRPDLKHKGARRRVAKLRHLLREAENGVFEIQQSSPDAPTIKSLRRYVSTHLSDIEQTEVEEMPGERHVPLRRYDAPDSSASTLARLGAAEPAGPGT